MCVNISMGVMTLRSSLLLTCCDQLYPEILCPRLNKHLCNCITASCLTMIILKSFGVNYCLLLCVQRNSWKRTVTDICLSWIWGWEIQNSCGKATLLKTIKQKPKIWRWRRDDAGRGLPSNVQRSQGSSCTTHPKDKMGTRETAHSWPWCDSMHIPHLPTKTTWNGEWGNRAHAPALWAISDVSRKKSVLSVTGKQKQAISLSFDWDVSDMMLRTARFEVQWRETNTMLTGFRPMKGQQWLSSGRSSVFGGNWEEELTPRETSETESP